MNIPPKENTFRRKIKTREQLREAIGPRPRVNKVIMCHGTFDLVHPGHIRHLMYAKDHADVLVASLTSDSHINKANFRPFVPQDLRAMNLAALECVDYVIIDDNETPIENLKVIQPDFFAKGYEYSEEGIHPKTREEMAVIESYGGELLFTPGDLVLSSSAIIETTPPNLATEKLLALLHSEGLNFGDLKTALTKLKGMKVHVVGDTIVDSYTYCSLVGGTAKTPTFSVKHEREVDFPGGAAVVAKHLRQAGAEVVFSTVLGDDGLKDFVLKDLEASGIECRAVIDPTRPTTQKNAFITNGYQADLHDLQLTPEGTALVTAYTTVTADLSAVGGSRTGSLLTCILQEIGDDRRPEGNNVRILAQAGQHLAHKRFTALFLAGEGLDERIQIEVLHGVRRKTCNAGTPGTLPRRPEQADGLL